MASSPTLEDPDYLKRVQASLDSTMPWIGTYIAPASAVCTLAMAADAFIGFRSKKYWLPSLGILVITIAGNMVSTALMLLFLATLCSVSLMAPRAKRYIGLKYNEMHKSVSNRQVEWGRFSSDEVENMVKGYWVMAQTSSPQFVLARSAISSTLGFWCLFTAAGLVKARISHRLLYPRYKVNSSVFVTSKYRWSVGWILNIQCTGVAIGTIAPLLRWFVASWFKICEMERKIFRDEVKVDKYWTWRLVEWRDRSLPFQVQSRTSKKLLRDAVRFVLNFCIGVQILVVLEAKLVLFLSARFGRAVLLCLRKNERPVLAGAHVDFSQYVLLLEGEPQLPYKVLKNICNEADELIKGGEKRIAHTILLGMGDGENQTDNELFVSISITISDILAACLTNLVQVITLKCHRSDIKEREESVRRAAILLGESKEIFDILQQRELPCLDVEKAANFDEWRASLELDIENPLASSSPSSSDNSTTV
ncbi:uncharacterized protein LOC121785255 [Salvia splendens]|uniref:uncharacterized protein LOC121785255 n=1 Tax=Salvia splendens TaxID=180675 RepID=UPI001C2551D2|nr:uncharacterized protein LOC121785255 [Salvia splendens]